ncbi:23S rRNA (pseudouridine(1915)-N(3))-methyltransferase RlmH [Chelatococcus sp. SYSU_G07232]|uniref:Ribosomal RNA large subunit methyltransferase H n=1 Tax=Chelatococcus albus TaxID=3047466 RepID=A0ABT7ADU2_9HYPH|nr:23S rRNA (pseudouridine(1915)-N(3))-methyltransferase RlmH [Chelatococcus sp. SYSU_G07232]MDJ1157550.1 23S rRNA (pseudouridine(1915)-N(3))-methyltransferase RlmH [Chelatococcus sp. SYSU_G07232]
MRLVVVSVGRLKAGPERSLVERYVERAAPLARSLGLGALDLVEIPESRARRDAERKAEEAAAILARLGAGPVVVFDERGAALSSEAVAARFGAWRDAGETALHLVVGGPDGLDEAVRRRATLVLSFGAMTLPHQLVRALVVEQLYRAMTILAGHPYHRA